MPGLTVSEFADKVDEIMPVIMREFLKKKTGEFYKSKITMPQFIVMSVLNEHGISKMTDLAKALNVTTAAMTGVVDKLVREGYATRSRDPKDRRIVNVRLIAKGANLVKKVIDERREMTIKMFSVISEEDRRKYLEILMHIKRHITGDKSETD